MNLPLIQVQIAAPTKTVGSGQLTIADSEERRFENPKRKQFVVHNFSTSTGSLLIKDGDGNVMDVLAAGDPPWTIESNGDFVVQASGGTCVYTVAQTIYTLLK